MTPQGRGPNNVCQFTIIWIGGASGSTWIFDEYQHAVRLVNCGRLCIVPVLLEPKGVSDAFTPEQVIDLTATPRDFGKLHDILAPDPIKLNEAEIRELSATVAQFDKLFLDEQWDASDDLLRGSPQLEHTFRPRVSPHAALDLHR